MNRDNNGAVLSLLSSQTKEPSVSTTSIPRTCSAVAPYFRQCGPPAFSAMLPPIVEALPLDGSGAK